MTLTKAESVDVYLSEAAREHLGVIINTLQVCEIMKKEALADNKFESFKRWRTDEQCATIELFEVFGVALPCLDDAQRCLNMVSQR